MAITSHAADNAGTDLSVSTTNQTVQNTAQVVTSDTRVDIQSSASLQAQPITTSNGSVPPTPYESLPTSEAPKSATASGKPFLEQDTTSSDVTLHLTSANALSDSFETTLIPADFAPLIDPVASQLAYKYRDGGRYAYVEATSVRTKDVRGSLADASVPYTADYQPMYSTLPDAAKETTDQLNNSQIKTTKVGEHALNHNNSLKLTVDSANHVKTTTSSHASSCSYSSESDSDDQSMIDDIKEESDIDYNLSTATMIDDDYGDMEYSILKDTDLSGIYFQNASHIALLPNFDAAFSPLEASHQDIHETDPLKQKSKEMDANLTSTQLTSDHAVIKEFIRQSMYPALVLPEDEEAEDEMLGRFV
jgi:hypothetical protein